MYTMKARTGAKAYLQYLLVRVIFAVMEIFPIEWNLRTARLAARLWPKLMRRHRDRAIAHLTQALGESLSREQIERLADRCLQNVAMFAVEAVCLPRRITPSTWSRYVRLTGFEEGLKVMLAGKGAIMVTAHYGSFELMGHLLAALSFDIVAVMRPLDNVYLNRFVVRSRQTHGLKLLDKKGAAARAEKMLTEGYLLAFIGDQDAGRKGMFVDFFGQPASTYKSIGLLAMSVKCPIVVAYARRLGDVGRYDVSVPRVIHPHEWQEQDDPLRWITQTYTTAIEEFVRADPEQYLWIHRRWKSKPRVKRMSTKQATFGAGCFWGVEAMFRKIDGVTDAAVGYCGGSTDAPSYEEVCSDTTAHAEVVQVTFDPARVSYEQLLEVFWNGHDPTTLNRQGPDVGSQYRSVVFYHNEKQRAAATSSKGKLDASGRFDRPIVTEIVPAAAFHRAEEYHQQYLEKQGRTSCSI